MKWVFTYLKALRIRIAAGITVKIIGILAELMIPFLLSHILENVIRCCFPPVCEEISSLRPCICQQEARIVLRFPLLNLELPPILTMCRILSE